MLTSAIGSRALTPSSGWAPVRGLKWGGTKALLKLMPAAGTLYEHMLAHCLQNRSSLFRALIDSGVLPLFFFFFSSFSTPHRASLLLKRRAQQFQLEFFRSSRERGRAAGEPIAARQKAAATPCRLSNGLEIMQQRFDYIHKFNSELSH